MRNLVIDLNNKLNNLKKQSGNAEGMAFVKTGDKNISVYSLEGISKQQQAQVYAFAKFLRENENLTQEELNKILKAKFFKFAFLRKLNKEIPNIIEELKTNNPNMVLFKWQQEKLIDKYEK